jgi:8-oxo-dGTP pyrophosphatase MutT (NUDIX family)
MTITHQDVQATVTRYLASYPSERDHLQPLLRSLREGRPVTSRHEFNGGHITCGAVVIDHDRNLLLVRHKTLGKWLLPGGHVESHDASLEIAALRELREETGVSGHNAVALPGQSLTPVDIDVHEIPANPVKNEPAHWHADFRYTFVAPAPDVRIQHEEITGWHWYAHTNAPTAKLATKLADL